ncbi:MAG TPA: polysaccharide deacetylase family protein [Vicinamibacterales bacterium]|nr:polysaccharide deacetylase family protein [Vicinamibacterales bacterium]
MFLLVFGLVAAVVALAHTAPFPFVLDALHDERVTWRMPHDAGPPTVYLTYDDGPNPAATPELLDELASNGVHATFFLIERHMTAETAPIVRRIAADGHRIGLHSHTRALMFFEPDALGRELTAFARRIEGLTGRPPCRVFRPHAGARSSLMLEGLRQIDYQMVGWGFMLWDFDLFRERSARIVPRLVRHASPGDIIVIHDGHHENPRADRRYAIAVTDALIPELRQKGFTFGTIC